jgi:hypothetical protein
MSKIATLACCLLTELWKRGVQAMTLKTAGVNDGFVVAEAIAFAIEGMCRLPSPYRLEGKIAELKDILNEKPQSERTFLQEDARRRVDILLGVPP